MRMHDDASSLTSRMREGETQRETERQTDRQNDRQTDRDSDRERETETDRTALRKDTILGSCLVLQSVHANLHANGLHIKQQ